MNRLIKTRPILAKAVLALSLAGLLGGVAAPAHADDRDRDRRGPPPRHYRRPPPHRFYAPPPVYAPPAVVYAPPPVSPGINLVIPLNIR